MNYPVLGNINNSNNANIKICIIKTIFNSTSISISTFNLTIRNTIFLIIIDVVIIIMIRNDHIIEDSNYFLYSPTYYGRDLN